MNKCSPTELIKVFTPNSAGKYPNRAHGSSETNIIAERFSSEPELRPLIDILVFYNS